MEDKKPIFVADTARIVGEVHVGDEVSFWYGGVARGDYAPITIGNRSNVQENATCHVSHGYPLVIGDYVTVGHNAIVHGCTIGNNVLIGMGAIVLNGAVIGDNCIIGAQALVTQHKVIPPNSLVVGSPGRVIREVTPEEIAETRHNADVYVKNGYAMAAKEAEKNHLK